MKEFFKAILAAIGAAFIFAVAGGLLILFMLLTRELWRRFLGV